MNKLPQDLQLVMSQRVTDSDWDLNSLINVIDKESDTRERTVTVLNPPHSLVYVLCVSESVI